MSSSLNRFEIGRDRSCLREVDNLRGPLRGGLPGAIPPWRQRQPGFSRRVVRRSPAGARRAADQGHDPKLTSWCYPDEGRITATKGAAV